MPVLFNASSDDVNLPAFGLAIPAGGRVEVPSAVADDFSDHPYLQVEPDPAPPAVDPAPVPADSAVSEVTVSVPVGEHVEIVPDTPAPPA